MNDYESLLQSETAVLQNAIEILQKLDGQADLNQIYDGFSAVLGRNLTENEASNVRRILDESVSSAAAAQFNGTYLYINSPDNQTYVLVEGEVSEDSQPGEASSGCDMSEALSKKKILDKKLTIPQDQTETVTEPGQLVTENTAITNKEQTGSKGAVDKQANAQALKDAGEEADPANDDFVEDSVKEAQDVIEKEKAKIAKHEEQIEKDKTKFMKDVHDFEIRHDKKVIEEQKEIISDLQDGKE